MPKSWLSHDVNNVIKLALYQKTHDFRQTFKPKNKNLTFGDHNKAMETSLDRKLMSLGITKANWEEALTCEARMCTVTGNDGSVY